MEVLMDNKPEKFRMKMTGDPEMLLLTFGYLVIGERLPDATSDVCGSQNCYALRHLNRAGAPFDLNGILMPEYTSKRYSLNRSVVFSEEPAKLRLIQVPRHVEFSV
jgi:hypothetical protein